MVTRARVAKVVVKQPNGAANANSTATVPALGPVNSTRADACAGMDARERSAKEVGLCEMSFHNSILYLNGHYIYFIKLLISFYFDSKNKTFI
jgi:hypothetical protein